MARKSKGNGLLLVGMVLGAAIGAGVTIFYTPANGEENRKRLTQWAGNRADEAKSKVQNVLPGDTETTTSASVS